MSPEDRMLRRVITAGLFLAITLLLVFTRFGMIPVPTPAANATVAHIPAIIAGILEGPLVGMIVGLGFGFASFMSATTPMFKDPLVAVLPRMFIGVTASWFYLGFRRAGRRTVYVLLAAMVLCLLGFSWQIARTTMWLGLLIGAVSLAGCAALTWWIRRTETPVITVAIAAGIGSVTNTILVLGLAVVRGYIAPEAAWGIGLTHGIPEMVVSGIITVAVVAALSRIEFGRRGSDL